MKIIKVVIEIKNVLLFFTVLMLLLIIACGKPVDTPVTEPEPVSIEGFTLEMSTKTTMAGVARYLTISANGSIIFIEETGIRHPTERHPAMRTTRAGQLTESELSSLVAMVDACPFDAAGECEARTEIIDTDAVCVLTALYGGRTRTITADYQPLFHLFHPKVEPLSDVSEPVLELYRELRYIIDNKTIQVSEEEIEGD